LPHALQNCTAPIVPHDQHPGVACPGIINDDLDSVLAIKS